MNIQKLNEVVAAVRGNELLRSSPQDALDLIATARYETGCEALILPKEIVSEDFFILSSGLAGEVLQKFVYYSMKVAIVGDFSGYTSKPLQDFIRESNEGRHVCFQPDEGAALAWLERAGA